MTDLKTQIGRFDAKTASVAVTFTQGRIVHKRSVNAVLDAKGRYDKDATAQRVADVANGVAHKIAIGAITAAPAEDPAPESSAE